MKPTLALRSFLLGSIVLSASPLLQAAARYWDGSDTGANSQGGNGTWDISTANWDSAATAGTDVTFASGPHQAVFGGTAGTVNVSGTVSVSGASTTAGTGGIVFTTAGYSIGGSGTIQLGGASFIHTLGTTTFGSSLIIDNNGNTLTLSNGGTFNGEIKGSGGLAKGGGGTATFTFANTYTGTTTITQGTLVTETDSLSNTNGAFGKSTSDINLGGAGLNNNQNASILIGGAFNVGRIIRAATSDGTDAGTRVLTLGGNTADNSIFSGDIFLGTTNRTSHGITVTAASGGQVSFSGKIQNPTGQDVAEAAAAAALTAVTKTGAGTVVLSGNNTYTGATNVSEGTLIINGSTSSTSLVTVANGATLGGSGTVGGATTVNGYLKPGNSTGLLTVGSLDINSTASTVLEINGVNRGQLSNGYDALNINTGGSIDLAGALSFTFGNLSAFANNTEFDLFSFTNTSTGDFASVTSTGFYAGTWSKSGEIWSLTDEGQTLNFSEVTGNLTVVPEPRAVLLGALAMFTLLRRRRN